MNIPVLDKLFDVADDLNNEMIYREGLCQTLVSITNNPEGLRCYDCIFYKSRKDGCMLSNALSILDDAKSAYKKIKK